MSRGLFARPHFVQANSFARIRSLPGSFDACQSATDDDDLGHVFGNLNTVRFLTADFRLSASIRTIALFSHSIKNQESKINNRQLAMQLPLFLPPQNFFVCFFG